jgi:hypothetical protein
MAAVADLGPHKAALAAAKRRGVKLGGDREYRLTAKARAVGRAVVQERVRSRAMDTYRPRFPSYARPALHAEPIHGAVAFPMTAWPPSFT